MLPGQRTEGGSGGEGGGIGGGGGLRRGNNFMRKASCDCELNACCRNRPNVALPVMLLPKPPAKHNHCTLHKLTAQYEICAQAVFLLRKRRTCWELYVSACSKTNRWRARLTTLTHYAPATYKSSSPPLTNWPYARTRLSSSPMPPEAIAKSTVPVFHT